MDGCSSHNSAEIPLYVGFVEASGIYNNMLIHVARVGGVLF